MSVPVAEFGASAAAAQTLGTLGERALVSWLRPRLPTRPDVLVGAGDDCAVVAGPRPGEELVLKSDPIAEGRHFAPGADPRLVGRKALGRVLSDFASMGAEPRWALVDFAAPAQTPADFARGALEGLSELALRFGVAVVGGDTSEAPVAQLHVFAAGVAPSGQAMLRSAARPGDAVFVTGEFGRSYESGRHFSFEPRLREGTWLRRRGVRCCIDVSDGLACEAWHVADESRVRIELRASDIPLSELCAAMPDSLRHALGDGEDFELLFTARPDVAAGLEDSFAAEFPGVRCARIGQVAASEDNGLVVMDGAELPRSGYEHFSA